MSNSSPSFAQAVKTLWIEGFFEHEKSIEDIEVAVNKKGYNPSRKTILQILSRAKYLTIKGSPRSRRYIQSYANHLVASPDKSTRSDLLRERGIHPKILAVSNKLFIDGHYSQAIFEAFKTVNNMVKDKSELFALDGRTLMAEAFKAASPKLCWSSLAKQSDKDEQEGFMLIYMGAMAGIRNPKAHEIVNLHDITKAIEYLSFASLLARRVDEAVIVT